MSTPEWTEAPAVLARLKFWILGGDPIVFARYEHDHDYWLGIDRPARHWSELTDVTPLYPKDEIALDRLQELAEARGYDRGFRLGWESALDQVKGQES